ncbi:MAG: Small Arf-related GTPase [Promethearchaeota archaeon]|nr:MAG: Small Arf-related GTPase [Candidatus Lokiarchaeota archaeon]
MENAFKIIISGLQNAGKTSILTALDKKYDFVKEVLELKPTIKVEYRKTKFLGSPTVFWDMGGQEKYRQLYLSKPEMYFDSSDLLIYVIDIQDSEKYNESLNYLHSVLEYFIDNDIYLPLIITFHKYDPNLRSYDEINENIYMLRDQIKESYPMFNILFQQTSIYDIISIIQLMSYGLSIFDGKFFELSLYMETSLNEFNCYSLILFDAQSVIISEYYNEDIEPNLYEAFLDSIKEHIYLIKRIEENEEEIKDNQNFFTMENELISYLYTLNVHNEKFFVSVILEEDKKDKFLEQYSDFIKKLEDILLSLVG